MTRPFQGQQWNTYKPVYNRPPGHRRPRATSGSPQIPYMRGTQNQLTGSRRRFGGRFQQHGNTAINLQDKDVHMAKRLEPQITTLNRQHMQVD